MTATYSSLNLVLLGGPGSGKSTQAGVLAQSYSVPHVSTHQMLRSEIGRGTIIGRQAQERIGRGELVPDRVLAGLILERLDRDDCARGFILDGYPRTAAQTALLDGILAELGRTIERVLLIEVPDQVGAQRLVAAGPPAVPDATPASGESWPAVVEERVRVWRENAPALVELYANRGLLLKIDGNRAVEDVSETLMQTVGAPVGA